MTTKKLPSSGAETNTGDNRCFGRLKARELTSDELDMVGGGDDPDPPPPCPPPPPPPYGGPDVIHSGIFANNMNGESGGGPDEIGNVYT